MANAATTTNEVDWNTIGLCVGVFAGGVIVGAFLLAPMIQKMKDKKKKTETPAK